MAKIKLNDLLSESKKQKVDEAILNEDASTTLLILSQMALANAAIQMAISRGATTGGHRDTRSMGEKLKDFYEKYTKVKPLMNKLDKDPDVQKFVKDNIGGDHKGYHNLIKSKLSPDEMKFLTKIKFDELPSVKDPEKSAQMKADRTARIKKQNQDSKNKQQAKLQKQAGGLDLDTTKVKNTQTGNDISLRTALGYGKTHPVYQAAMNMVKQRKNTK